MQLASSRRRFLRLCLTGGLPLPLGLVGCAASTDKCDTTDWVIAPRAEGDFFDCYQMSILGDVADLVLGTRAQVSAQGAEVIDYIDAMIDYWAGPTLKARLSRLPGFLDTYAAEHAGIKYPFLQDSIRRQTLAEFDAAAFAEQDAQVGSIYREFKSLMLHIYFSSEEMNRDYVRLPGMYVGDLSEGEYLALLRTHIEAFDG